MNEINKMVMIYRYFKRSIDFIFGLFFLIVLSPLLGIISFVVWLFSGRPITYNHPRVGQNGYEFKVYKFRSMVINARDKQKKIEEKKNHNIVKMLNMPDVKVSNIYKFLPWNAKDLENLSKKSKMKSLTKIGGKTIIPLKGQKLSQYLEILNNAKSSQKKLITVPGKYIRLLHIDELLQLWNIVMGDMSFIGPRAQDVEHYNVNIEKNSTFANIYKVKPGLAGLASVLAYLPKMKRQQILKEIGLIKKLENKNHQVLDDIRIKEGLYYVKHQSFLLDLEILAWTVYEEIYSLLRLFKKDFL